VTRNKSERTWKTTDRVHRSRSLCIAKYYQQYCDLIVISGRRLGRVERRYGAELRTTLRLTHRYSVVVVGSVCDACRRRRGSDAIALRFAVRFRQGSGNGGGDGRCVKIAFAHSHPNPFEAFSHPPPSACRPKINVSSCSRHDIGTDYTVQRVCFVVYDCRVSTSDRLCRRFITAYLIYSVVREAITKTVHCSHQNVDDGRARREPRSFTTAAAVFVARNLTLTFRFYSVCWVCSRAMITMMITNMIDDFVFYIFTYP